MNKYCPAKCQEVVTPLGIAVWRGNPAASDPNPVTSVLICRAKCQEVVSPLGIAVWRG